MAATSTVFLSYRRSDTQDVAGRIFDALAAGFGRQRVFKDVDSIPIGSDFREHIVEQIRQSVVLVLIGPNWLEPGFGPEQSRLWEPQDFVRLEIETALECGSPMVPVLINGARMPDSAALPPSILPLRGRHGFAVRPDPDFRSDVGRLGDLLKTMVQGEPEKRKVPAQLLDDLFASCQAWYNDIVGTVARIVALMRDQKMDAASRAAAIEGIQLVYQNSRTYVPKVLSSRRMLSRFEGTEGIAAAVDGFLSHIYVETNDRQARASYCRPPMEWLMRERTESPFSVLSAEHFSAESSFASDYLDISLGRISEALQALSDAISEAKLYA
jgi:hypothetical protein